MPGPRRPRRDRFSARTKAGTGSELPQFIKNEFDAFLKCGILAHGFLRLRCGGRGSLGGPRHPHVPVRQWVLSLPIPLRLLLAAQPELVTAVLQVVPRVLGRRLLQQAGLAADKGHGSAVTLIQRFASAANLNLHRQLRVPRCKRSANRSFLSNLKLRTLRPRQR